ncbi:hypothetical protein [Acinetobacter calcoaceticus]|uniref:hypothetical protein n=1 Tax=Acinetobacter calcoaceticus TaxID=471 RepID=UPI003A8A525B
MPTINLDLKTKYQSKATFEGIIEPVGSTGYKFSGTLKASCNLDRSSTDFRNTVALGHGGTSGEYTYLEFELENNGVEGTFTVKGEGTRKPNETVDFRVGFNEGISKNSSFTYGDKITTPVGGPSQAIKPLYIVEDSIGNRKYDVRFDGHVRADGPTGFVIEGTFSAHSMPGTMTTQRATFGYKSSKEGWNYKTYACDDTPQDFKIFGTRNAGEKITIQVGATSGIGNAYGYGDQIVCMIPEHF